LDLNKIQGNVAPGFNKDHQAFVLVRFGSAEAGRASLADLQPDIATAQDVQDFKELFDRLRKRAPLRDDRDGGALSHVSATWVNVALSFAGIRRLALPGADSQWPVAFRQNRVPGADTSLAPGEVDGLVIVAADRAEDRDREVGRIAGRLASCGVEVAATWCGDTLPGAQRGHEHFGFKDGVSQPRIAGTKWGLDPPVAAGEFVLGYPDQTGKPSGAGLPAWAQNGSFLAFVQMHQHVGAFWHAMKQQAQQFGVEPAEVAAWIVGRRRDAEGTPLCTLPSRESHIGRAYARWLPPSESLRHRILRRGIPYGPPLAGDEPEDGRPRGLYFLTYQADIERQFEHVWTQWLNSQNFPVRAAGRDGLVGQVVDPGSVRSGAGTSAPVPPWSPSQLRPAIVPRGCQPLGGIALRLATFVTPLYGTYFFAPSVESLSSLATGSRKGS
jgi:Dyp-type peroxidase family